MSTRILIVTLPIVVLACASQSAGPRAAPGVEMSDDSSAVKAYKKTCQAGLDAAQGALSTLEGLTGDKTTVTVLEPLNQLWMSIDGNMNRAGLFSAVHPDAGMREAADHCEQDLKKLVTEIGMSRPLYDAVAAVDVSGEDEVTQRYVRHLLRDFRRAGVDKDEATRKKIRDLNEELVKLGQEFGKNIREDVRSIDLGSPGELDGLPPDYIDAEEHQPGDNGKITITTNYPDYIPFMTYAQSDPARLALYREFRKRGYPLNLEVLSEMLAKRHELATLLGYENWATYITEDKMIKTEAAAREFIEKIKVVAAERSKRDYDELLTRLQKDDPKATKVGDWQKSYIEEIVKREKYAFDSQEVRKYFNFDKTRDGLFDLTGKMFGIEYRRVAQNQQERWHDTVETWEITADGATIGRFHLDMFPRDDKYKHAAAFPIITGVSASQLPEAALVCNFPAEGPMEHDQVETFFHEFGHLLHHLLGGDHRWLGVSGFNTEWDFVEAPSQMLEEWAWHSDTLKTFATSESGEVIPDDLIAAMRRARDFGQGLWAAHQMFYAAVSLNYYSRDPAGLDTTTLMKELQEQYSPFDYVEDTYFQLSFGHLDGYSAIYYTYMWSLVIAKDLFGEFEKAGLLDSELAHRYRDKILAPGGSRDAAVMVKDFLGRDYTFDAFANWLNK